MKIALLVVVGGLTVMASTSDLRAEANGGFEHFVTRSGDQLLDGDRSLRFISWNIPNLHCIEDSFSFLGASPWRWPDEFEITDALESVRQMGGQVVRPYVITVRRQGSDMGDHVHVLAPGEFNERAFETLDLLLKIAAEKRVRVIIPLVDNWKWMGGIEQYAVFRGKQGKEFWSDQQLIEDFQRTIDYIVNRRNTLTGRLYRDDKAILAWETGNELDSTPAWTRTIAAYLKQLDPNHLVIDGRSLHGVPLTSLDDPNVDVITTHHYPNSGVKIAERVVAAAKLTSKRKPYFVGEVGFISLDEAQQVFDAVVDHHVCGALYWSLRFHRREGGFYWHNEPLGGNLFKAYHWPGFASGDGYREIPMLQMICRNAYRIRALAPPPVAPPAPPRLLPIEHPGLISWQGSAGAAAYDIERSDSADGPWKRVGTDVSDAAVQYRPLFCDATAEPGDLLYYRVVGKNSGGPSAPSNIVGPVSIETRLLVDEMLDNTLLHALEGPVERLSDHPRRTQEDIHRLALGPDGTLTYRLPTAVAKVRVFVFDSTPRPSLEIAASADGQSFTPLATKRTGSARDAGDYDYLLPVMIEALSPGNDARYVRLRNLGTGTRATDSEKSNSSHLQISRVEISCDGS
jgi:mannan endo-1,4-beta-mannosidase